MSASPKQPLGDGNNKSNQQRPSLDQYQYHPTPAAPEFHIRTGPNRRIQGHENITYRAPRTRHNLVPTTRQVETRSLRHVGVGAVAHHEIWGPEDIGFETPSYDQNSSYFRQGRTGFHQPDNNHGSPRLMLTTPQNPFLVDRRSERTPPMTENNFNVQPRTHTQVHTEFRDNGYQSMLFESPWQSPNSFIPSQQAENPSLLRIDEGTSHNYNVPVPRNMASSSRQQRALHSEVRSRNALRQHEAFPSGRRQVPPLASREVITGRLIDRYLEDARAIVHSAPRQIEMPQPTLPQVALPRHRELNTEVSFGHQIEAVEAIPRPRGPRCNRAAPPSEPEQQHTVVYQSSPMAQAVPSVPNHEERVAASVEPPRLPEIVDRRIVDSPRQLAENHWLTGIHPRTERSPDTTSVTPDATARSVEDSEIPDVPPKLIPMDMGGTVLKNLGQMEVIAEAGTAAVLTYLSLTNSQKSRHTLALRNVSLFKAFWDIKILVVSMVEATHESLFNHVDPEAVIAASSPACKKVEAMGSRLAVAIREMGSFDRLLYKYNLKKLLKFLGKLHFLFERLVRRLERFVGREIEEWRFPLLDIRTFRYFLKEILGIILPGQIQQDADTKAIAKELRMVGVGTKFTAEEYREAMNKMAENLKKQKALKEANASISVVEEEFADQALSFEAEASGGNSYEVPEQQHEEEVQHTFLSPTLHPDQRALDEAYARVLSRPMLHQDEFSDSTVNSPTNLQWNGVHQAHTEGVDNGFLTRTPPQRPLRRMPSRIPDQDDLDAAYARVTARHLAEQAVFSQPMNHFQAWNEQSRIDEVPVEEDEDIPSWQIPVQTPRYLLAANNHILDEAGPSAAGLSTAQEESRDPARSRHVRNRHDRV